MHKGILVTIVVTLAAMLPFLPPSSPAERQQQMAQLDGAVGVTAGVLPNPYNTLAQNLKEREAALDAREASLPPPAPAGDDGTLPYVIGIGALLLLLIGANFYFDYRRSIQQNP